MYVMSLFFPETFGIMHNLRCVTCPLSRVVWDNWTICFDHE